MLNPTDSSNKFTDFKKRVKQDLYAVFAFLVINYVLTQATGIPHKGWAQTTEFAKY